MKNFIKNIKISSFNNMTQFLKYSETENLISNETTVQTAVARKGTERITIRGKAGVGSRSYDRVKKENPAAITAPIVNAK